MTSVGWSTLDVIPSVKNLRSQLERQTSRDFTAAGKRGGEQFGDAAGKSAATKFKSRFAGLGREIIAPIAGLVAGAAVVDLFKDAIGGASDLAESGNKIDVIFGKAATTVDAFASKGAKALGATKLDVLNAAGSFGTFGKAAGLTGDELAGFSTKLVGLSTDLASFFNTSPEQAVEAIGAALRGEGEPIRQYGVLLDDATLRQEALRQGLIATTKQALTPQQRVLAAYQVILKQTTDAQGDFSRTSGGLANQQRILSAQWSEMKTELGSKLLPAVTATVHTFNDGVIPAVEGAGGVISDAVGWFNQLPAPVKAATGALVAFRAAQALGVGNAFAAGTSLVSRGLEDVRLRAMLVSDEYKRLRQGQLDIIQGSGKFTPAAGRMASALGAIEVGAIGAGRALKAGLSGALGLVGGPWGAAFIAGTAIVTHFWQEHQKAKARVESMTEALDKQTGALTADNRELAFKALQDSGAVDAAKKMSLSLSLLTDAALGNKGAINAVNVALDQNERAIFSAAGVQGRANGAALAAVRPMQTIREALDGQNSELETSKADWRDHAEAMKTSTTTTGSTTAATETYTSKLKAARDAVRGLMDAENKRKGTNLTAFQDQTRLAQALADAQKEAKDGKRTLDANAEAGRNNRDALASLADAWNSAGDSVKNAKGAYQTMRQNFIDVAKSMGASQGQAQKLANQLLGIPKNTPATVTTPGMKAAIEKVKELKEELRAAQALSRIVITAQASGQRQNRDTFATGGIIGGKGTGTSDSNLIWASRGEFMQPKAAVDYYGPGFMEAVRRRQLPRYADGGLIGGGIAAPVMAPIGSDIRGVLSIDRDGHVFLSGVARAEVDAAARTAAHDRRLSSLDGRRR